MRAARELRESERGTRMTKSQRLRLGDVDGVVSLVGECRELWADAHGWQNHLVRGACRLTGQAVAHYGELALPAPGRAMRMLSMAACGWRDDAARRLFEQYGAQVQHPDTAFPGAEQIMRAAAADPRGHVVALREQLCADRDWYRSSYVNDFRRPAFNDGMAFSVVIDPGGGGGGGGQRMSMLGVHQDLAEAPPTARTRQILALLHGRIAPLAGAALATHEQLGLHGLSVRLREVLERLLEGDSEKQIGQRLKLARPTIHQYVGALHRHFGVASRGELLAYFVRRQPRAGRGASDNSRQADRA